MSSPAEAVANRDHAAALIGTLVAGGVRHAVVSPGSRNTPIVLALQALAEADARLQLHSVLDERTAAFMALGLSRATSSPVVLSCTSGSAGAHYLPAIIEAFHAHIPLIALTADRPPELQGRGSPQTIDQGALFGVHVHLTMTLPPPNGSQEAVRAAAEQALSAAASGPVHINAQYRKPLWHPDAPAKVDLPSAPHSSQPALEVSAEAHKDLCRRVAAAERGVIVWGPDPDPVIDAGPVVALAEHLGWPVLADPTSPCRFRAQPKDLCMGAHDAYLRSPKIADTLQPDLVIQLGGTPSSNALRAMVGAASDVISIDSYGVWRDPEHSLKTLITARPAAVCAAVREALPARENRDWLTQWRTVESHAREALNAACSTGWWSGAIVQELLQALPKGSLLNAASSMPIRDLDGFGQVQSKWLHAVASRGVNGIDGTLATTIGLAKGWRDGPTAVLMGDLAFLHDQSSLMLARGLQSPVVVVLIDNGGGGIFEYLPISKHESAFEPWFLTPQGADIQGLCAANAVHYTRIDATSALQTALPQALERVGLSVLHLPIDRADDLVRHHAAWKAAQDQ